MSSHKKIATAETLFFDYLFSGFPCQSEQKRAETNLSRDADDHYDESLDMIPYEPRLFNNT